MQRIIFLLEDKWKKNLGNLIHLSMGVFDS